MRYWWCGSRWLLTPDIFSILHWSRLWWVMNPRMFKMPSKRWRSEKNNWRISMIENNLSEKTVLWRERKKLSKISRVKFSPQTGKTFCRLTINYQSLLILIKRWETEAQEENEEIGESVPSESAEDAEDSGGEAGEVCGGTGGAERGEEEKDIHVIWLHQQHLDCSDAAVNAEICFRNCSMMSVKREQAHTLKKELEDGLEKWRQQVLEVQENNIRCHKHERYLLCRHTHPPTFNFYKW